VGNRSFGRFDAGVRPVVSAKVMLALSDANGTTYGTTNAGWGVIAVGFVVAVLTGAFWGLGACGRPYPASNHDRPYRQHRCRHRRDGRQYRNLDGSHQTRPQTRPRRPQLPAPTHTRSRHSSPPRSPIWPAWRHHSAPVVRDTPMSTSARLTEIPAHTRSNNYRRIDRGNGWP
jgi:hypothetical protein